jgi:hypothetical protein
VLVCAAVVFLVVVGRVLDRIKNIKTQNVGENLQPSSKPSKLVALSASPTFRLCAVYSMLILITVFGVYGFGYDLSGFIYTQF